MKKMLKIALKNKEEELNCALTWTENTSNTTAESFVNLIPTVGGGTHVNGLRSGLTEALKEFCEFRNLIPKNIKLTPDDVWQRIAYVLSIKILDPQFSGQTKERLSSRECASFVSGVVKDSFSLWLNQHTDIAEKIAELAILNEPLSRFSTILFIAFIISKSESRLIFSISIKASSIILNSLLISFLISIKEFLYNIY